MMQNQTALLIEHEIRAAVTAALDSGGVFDVRKLGKTAKLVLSRLPDYDVFKKVLLNACKKDAALWKRVAPLVNNPATKALVDGGVHDVHNEIKRG